MIYRGPNGHEFITLDSIENRVDFEEVKYNIYCSTIGCDCRIEYVPQGIKVAYFKKWRGDEYQHSLDCPYYVDTETGVRPRKRLGILSSRLRNTHKDNVLKDMYKKYMESEEEREARKERERVNRRNWRNKRVEENETPIEEIVNRPTTDTQGEVLLEGERNPPVPRSYSIIHISRDQLESTVALMDIIIEVENDFNNSDEKRTVITLTNQNRSRTFKIILDPVFFAQSPLNIDRMLEGIKQRVMHGETMILGAIGQIIERDNELCMAVLGEDSLRINGKTIFVYLSNLE